MDPDRAKLFADLMRDNTLCPGGISKLEFRAAVDAADTWADTNAASFNAALPQPARAALNARQKAALLMFVIRRRFEIS